MKLVSILLVELDKNQKLSLWQNPIFLIYLNIECKFTQGARIRVGSWTSIVLV